MPERRRAATQTVTARKSAANAACAVVLACIGLAGVGLWAADPAAGRGLTESEQTMLDALWDLGVDSDRLMEVYDPAWVVEDVQRQILERWAAGDEAAVTELSKFRQVVLDNLAGEPVTDDLVRRRFADSSGWGRPSQAAEEGDSLLGVPCLLRAMFHTVEELAEIDTATLFAMASFFRSSYAQQMQPPRRAWLADLSKWSFYHWTEWMVLLADPESEAAQELGGRPEAPYEAAQQWVLMADLLERMRIYQAGDEARGLYHRVLALRPEHRLALYRAGFLGERYGDYRRAARWLDRLSEIEPGDHEVRLRLGVNLARSGDPDRGEETLRQLIDAGDEVPNWMRIVGYQELARIQSHELSTAQSTLDAAIDQFPDAWRLRVQRAGLDVAEWSSASATSRDVTAGWTADAGESARTRYERSRDDELLAARRAYLEAVVVHREVLRSALDRLDGRRHDSAYHLKRQRFRGCEGVISDAVVERLSHDPPPPRMP